MRAHVVRSTCRCSLRRGPRRVAISEHHPTGNAAIPPLLQLLGASDVAVQSPRDAGRDWGRATIAGATNRSAVTAIPPLVVLEMWAQCRITVTEDRLAPRGPANSLESGMKAIFDSVSAYTAAAAGSAACSQRLPTPSTSSRAPEIGDDSRQHNGRIHRHASRLAGGPDAAHATVAGSSSVVLPAGCGSWRRGDFISDATCRFLIASLFLRYRSWSEAPREQRQRAFLAIAEFAGRATGFVDSDAVDARAVMAHLAHAVATCASTQGASRAPSFTCVMHGLLADSTEYAIPYLVLGILSQRAHPLTETLLQMCTRSLANSVRRLSKLTTQPNFVPPSAAANMSNCGTVSSDSAARGEAAQMLSTLLRFCHEGARRLIDLLLRLSVPASPSQKQLDRQYAVELATQLMVALKHAPLEELCDTYCALLQSGLVTPVVQNKFLANCGIIIGTTGGPASAGGAAAAAQVVHAVRSLVGSGLPAERLEEGLVHGSAALIALGRDDVVREVYTALPALRVTRSLVEAHIRAEDAESAVAALSRLGAGRESWSRTPQAVADSCNATCRLVGKRGGAAWIHSLFVALASFRGSGRPIAQNVEYLIVGICDRVKTVTDVAAAGTPPRQVVGQILPVVKAAIELIGDDFNLDTILELIECSLRAVSFAVPLTAAIMWQLNQSPSLTLRHVFGQCSSTMANVSALHYYALCFARDHCSPETLDHLGTVWQCDVRPIRARHRGLDPMLRLWQCPACGRLNSDRFSYCLCSALRYSFVICAKCNYSQDERHAQCLSCGQPALSAAGASQTTDAGDTPRGVCVYRKAWICSACGGANGARQTHLCAMCHAATGPVATAALEGTQPLDHHCGACGHRKALPTAQQAMCPSCAYLPMQHARVTSRLWWCTCCGAWRSSLDRLCMQCHRVDYLPAALSRPFTELLWCPRCDRFEDGTTDDRVLAPSMCDADSDTVTLEAHRLATSCSRCHGALELSPRGGLITPVASSVGLKAECGSGPEAALALVCPDCGAVSAGETTVNDACATCGSSLTDAEIVHVRERRCVDNGHVVGRSCISAVCPQCGGLVRPVGEEGWSGAVMRHTLEDIFRFSGGTSSLAVILGGVYEGVQSASPETLAAIHHRAVLSLGQMHARITESVLSSNFEARRCVALSRKILGIVEAYTGPSESDPSVGAGASALHCSLCLGRHPEELCMYHAAKWICQNCGAESGNEDVCRYVCKSCLALRPAVAQLCPAEAWECDSCHRANAEFELYCIFCGVLRDTDNGRRASLTGHAETEPPDAEAAKLLRCVVPFAPAKCPDCSLVYLEATCPLCANRNPSVTDVPGVVCHVSRDRFALIQPDGTKTADKRVYVSQKLLCRVGLGEGDRVHFSAVLCEQGGYRATCIRR